MGHSVYTECLQKSIQHLYDSTLHIEVNISIVILTYKIVYILETIEFSIYIC